MSWNPKDDFSENYDKTTSDIDYSDPAYYQDEMSKTPRSAQPVQSLDPSTLYSNYAHELPSDKLDYNAELMTPYRGPSSIEGYTADIGAEQREAVNGGTTERSNKRKGLAGLGGLGAALSALLLKFPLLASLLKFGLVGFSALFSVAVYSLFFGWQFAAGLVLLLFVHEMGHAVVMKLSCRCDCRDGLFSFSTRIPKYGMGTTGLFWLFPQPFQSDTYCTVRWRASFGSDRSTHLDYRLFRTGCIPDLVMGQWQ